MKTGHHYLDRNNCTCAPPLHLNIIADADCSSYENTALHANCLRCCGMTPDLNYRGGVIVER